MVVGAGLSGPVAADALHGRGRSGCVPAPAPGVLTSARSAVTAPVGRLHWAGAESSPVWEGHMEGAVLAGRRATVHGRVDPGYEAVRDALADNLAANGELGAAVCLYRDGVPVVDAWGGWADPWTGQPYPADALQLVFSVTKAVAAAAAAVAVDDGLLDPRAPVADLWPEFAAGGKGAVTVSQVLSHQAGLPAVDRRLTLQDVVAGGPLVRALAAQRPLWQPGAAHGYHPVTYGALADEILRRATGHDVAGLVTDRMASRLGVEFHLGSGRPEPHRVMPLLDSPPSTRDRAAGAALRWSRSLYWRATTLDGALDGPSTAGLFNRTDVAGAALPAACGITDARSLARLFAALIGPVDGVRLASADTVAALTRPLSRGRDRVLGVDSAFGTGFGLPSRLFPLSGPESGPGSGPGGRTAAFGHTGVSGSLVWADPVTGAAFAYVTNRFAPRPLDDPRQRALIRAVHIALEETP